MRKYVLYGHDGSANHGCEAIVRTTTDVLGQDKNHTILVSAKPEEDIKYHVSDSCRIIKRGEKVDKIKKNVQFIKAYYDLKIKHDYESMDFLSEERVFRDRFYLNNKDLALSIGGDSYCYSDNMRKQLFHQHQLFKRMKMKTVLWGCSFEPELLEDRQIAEDIRSFDLITARESISYNALKGVNPNTFLTADSAFILKEEQLSMPDGFDEGDIVGINISPLIERKEPVHGVVRRNIEKLIEAILKDTSFKVLLIPHVVWENNNDFQMLNELYDRYNDLDRVAIVEDHNCRELKGYISRCRFFIGARTHATIAAYSSGVPTLVLGYSTKSKGIAQDLFGTFENYVLPIQNLKNDSELTKSWEWLLINEDGCRKRLQDVLPDYISHLYKGVNILKSL